jgi:hypothetical protein
MKCAYPLGRQAITRSARVAARFHIEGLPQYATLSDDSASLAAVI